MTRPIAVSAVELVALSHALFTRLCLLDDIEGNGAHPCVCQSYPRYDSSYSVISFDSGHEYVSGVERSARVESGSPCTGAGVTRARAGRGGARGSSGGPRARRWRPGRRRASRGPRAPRCWRASGRGRRAARGEAARRTRAAGARPRRLPARPTATPPRRAGAPECRPTPSSSTGTSRRSRRPALLRKIRHRYKYGRVFTSNI